MRPQTIGRVLGIGVRIAGRVASQRLAGGPNASPQPVTVNVIAGPTTGRATAGTSTGRPAPRSRGRTAAPATGSLARGLGGFFRPFQRVGGIVLLEVVGLFFLLFVLVFGQSLWRMRLSALHGPDHKQFLVAAGLLLLFLYLGVSSFWRARRK